MNLYLNGWKQQCQNSPPLCIHPQTSGAKRWETPVFSLPNRRFRTPLFRLGRRTAIGAAERRWTANGIDGKSKHRMWKCITGRFKGCMTQVDSNWTNLNLFSWFCPKILPPFNPTSHNRPFLYTAKIRWTKEIHPKVNTTRSFCTWEIQTWSFAVW